MAKIFVKRRTENDELMRFSVVVEGENSTSRHTVHLKIIDYEHITERKITPEELIEQSFKFLLSREAKESILKEFDLMEIQRYFPEYKTEIKSAIK